MALRKVSLGVVLCLSAVSIPHRLDAQASSSTAHRAGPAESLYLQLSGVGLDPNRVFRVRDSSLDRPAIHITLEDGTIAFTQDVLGRITGAFFAGDGEILLVPPKSVERKSMELFTGMAILEERFSTAYFRFNDSSAVEMQPGLRAAENAPEFVARWDETARNLAQPDAMRLLSSFIELLPMEGGETSAPSIASGDRLLHARLQGNTLGVFDVVYDSSAGEPVEAGQVRSASDGTAYYDVWASFSPEDQGGPATRVPNRQRPLSENELQASPTSVSSYVIDAQVKPPKELDADVRLDWIAERDGSRFMEFELSRFLKIQSLEADGKVVEYIQNPAVEGTRLARSGNDVVAVILPKPVRKGQQINLRFVYGGEVLAEAAKGLLYVGARGNWYPNRGLDMSDFDLTFHYPPGWTLVATGRPTPIAAPQILRAPGSAKAGTMANEGPDQAGRWVSERPIPVAGFDLGKYIRVATQAGDVTVETYATSGVERDFPTPAPQVEPDPEPSVRKATPPVSIASVPSPARNAAAVAESAARAVRYYEKHLGPFPYSKLALTQLPGRESQGWPGLIFLSSYAFLTPEERRDIRMDVSRELMNEQVPAHEAAHQWWGDLVTWKTYRDQWFSEGLANYCALMMVQEKNPEGFRGILENYRRDLVRPNKDGNLPKDAGPVTLGSRLLSSRFPEGYEAISYGRGTWLFHMLRSMMQDAAQKDPAYRGTEEPFLRSLRKLRDRYEGKAVSTQQIFQVFAEDLPPSLRYEGKSSLEWFVDGWVNGTSLPKLELQNVKFAPGANGVTVSGVIRQKDADENLVTSVPIYGVAVGSGKSPALLGRIFADGAESSFRLTAPAGTHKLLLDPGATILSAPK